LILWPSVPHCVICMDLLISRVVSPLYLCVCVCVCVSVCVSVSFIATAIEQHMECLQLSVMRHRIQYTQSHSSTRTHTHVFGGLQVVSPSCVSFIATAIEQHMECLQLSVMRHRIQYTQSHLSTHTHTHTHTHTQTHMFLVACRLCLLRVCPLLLPPLSSTWRTCYRGHPKQLGNGQTQQGMSKELCVSMVRYPKHLIIVV
jgi:F0F1-type ATP synthase epsilon subunit